MFKYNECIKVGKVVEDSEKLYIEFIDYRIYYGIKCRMEFK